MRPSSVTEETSENIQWSNADIEFPSTSTSDEIEIISQPDDEAICKLLSALPVPSDSVHSPCEEQDEQNETEDITQPTAEMEIASAPEQNLESGKTQRSIHRILFLFLNPFNQFTAHMSSCVIGC